MLRVAVAGNPNSGKTTLFNRLTGARAKVGNYPGITVERKEATGALPSGRPVRFIDLPGCYSLTARSPEEEVAHEVLVGALGDGKPELVICVVDATSVARGLYLALQLRELGVPMVLALNMVDVATAQGLSIDAAALEERLGCPVVQTTARDGTGIPALLEAVERTSAGATTTPPPLPAPALALAPREAEAKERVEQALVAVHGLAAAPGHALWLLASRLELSRSLPSELHQTITSARQELPPDFSRRVIQARYAAIDAMLVGVLDERHRTAHTTTEKLDRVLLHPVWGLAIFFATMFVLFQAVFAWAEPMISGIEILMGWLADGAGAFIPLPLVRSLVTNGLIAGVGSVLVFLPQIALLFLGLTVLEESGYLARAAFLLDRLMRGVGLHGKAFVPLMSGFACAVPAIMAARTIESRRDRLVTVMVTPFMSCSARLPVYVLVVAAVFSAAPPLFGVLSIGGLVVAAMYLLGFLVALGTAFVLKRSLLSAPPPPFLLELPTYKWPPWRDVARRVLERCRVFVVQTGGVILALSLLLWAILSFPRLDGAALDEAALGEARRAPAGIEVDPERAAQAAQLEHSLGGRLGRAIEPVIEPLGFDWRIGIGLVASFAAREVLVSTLGQVYAQGADVEPDSPALRDALLADKDPATGRARFSPLVGLSLMVFFVLAMQCLSTVATVKRETNSWRWPLLQLAYMNGLAYLASLAVFQIGTALGWG